MKRIHRKSRRNNLSWRNWLNSYQQYWLEFLFAMTEKEIKARYKHALLGFLWVILNPLLQMMVIGFVFQFFVPVKVNNYFLFLFTGLLPWNFFAYTVSKNTTAIINERALIQKAKFPRESLIFSIVLSNAFHLAMSLLLLLIALLADKIFLEAYTMPQILMYGLRFFGLLPAIIWLLALTSGFSLLTSALNVKFRDVNFVVQAIMPLWFYATPIIYTLNLLPQRLQIVSYINPMTGVTELFHWILLEQQPTNWYFWWISIVFSIFLVVISWKIFKRESLSFDDWV